MPVNIDEFYDQEPRRRTSNEHVYGREWSQDEVRCEVAWVADTGELYLMQEPGGQMKVGVDPAIVFYPSLTSTSAASLRLSDECRFDALTVEILGVIQRREDVERVMAGWQEAMAGANSIEWVRNRIRSGESAPE